MDTDKGEIGHLDESGGCVAYSAFGLAVGIEVILSVFICVYLWFLNTEQLPLPNSEAPEAVHFAQPHSWFIRGS